MRPDQASSHILTLFWLAQVLLAFMRVHYMGHPHRWPEKPAVHACVTQPLECLRAPD